MPKRSGSYVVPFSFDLLSFDEAVGLAADTGRISGDAGPLLETVVDMLDELGRPDEYFDCIQVAGTNGKTSTTRFSAAILRGEGLKTALYTSPQLVRYPERMEVDGRVVSDEAFARGVSAAVEAGRRVNAHRVAAGERAYTITPFDLLTAAALVVFAEACVDVAVLEVGMGGRWDATSATDPVAVAITGIGLDHTRILGDTLEAIAGEKAAVIKPGRLVVLGEGTHEASVQRVMDARCRECGVVPLVVSHATTKVPAHVGDTVEFSCTTPRAIYTSSMVKPAYQPQNAACAIMLCEGYLGRELDPQEDELAVDLYCGAGTFTLPLARRCDFVAAVEAYGPAVRDLRRNLEINKLDNVDVIGGDAVREFPDQDADVLVVDPPRAGLAPEAIDLIASTSARDVAYVSCDPATLARDLKRFVEEGTFSPVKITPVDLFPQTFHCETVVHLKRN